jgi:hypothetical protein
MSIGAADVVGALDVVGAGTADDDVEPPPDEQAASTPAAATAATIEALNPIRSTASPSSYLNGCLTNPPACGGKIYLRRLMASEHAAKMNTAPTATCCNE